MSSNPITARLQVGTRVRHPSDSRAQGVIECYEFASMQGRAFVRMDDGCGYWMHRFDYQEDSNACSKYRFGLPPGRDMGRGDRRGNRRRRVQLCCAVRRNQRMQSMDGSQRHRDTDMPVDRQNTAPVAAGIGDEFPKAQVPTEAEWDLWRTMVPRIRRCITIGMKKPGRSWDAAATVDEIASACRITPGEVVRMIGMCGWLIAVNEDADEIGQRTVYEDGE